MADGPQAAAPARGRTRGGPLGAALGLGGELLITLGVLLVLFVAWQLVWTAVVADAEMDPEVASLEAPVDAPPARGGTGPKDGASGEGRACVASGGQRVARSPVCGVRRPPVRGPPEPGPAGRGGAWPLPGHGGRGDCGRGGRDRSVVRGRGLGRGSGSLAPWERVRERVWFPRPMGEG